MNNPLLLSSRNPDKVQEFREILKSCNITLHSMLDFPDLPETIEDADTIYGNAIKKRSKGQNKPECCAWQTTQVCL
jgi:inosine/xanthosine triphosphate pyrophosphatase family protein